MPTDYFLDNDLIIKLIRYGLVDPMLSHCDEEADSRRAAVLATAKWVCTTALERAIGRHGESSLLLQAFEAFLAAVEVVEPSQGELEFAAQLEDLASSNDLPLDAGESVLAAIVASRLGLMLTGDKRAIVALEALLDEFPALQELAGRVGSLEQAMMTLLVHLGIDEVSDAVQRAPEADKAMKLALTAPPSIDGLLSYLADLRRRAPRILVCSDSLCFDSIDYALRNTA